MPTVNEVIDSLPVWAQWEIGITDEVMVVPMTFRNARITADAVTEANARYLNEHWADYVTAHSTHFGLQVALPLDEEAPEDLRDVIMALLDYPVLCESTLSEVEMEWINEAWDDYGRDEVRSLPRRRLAGL